MEWWSSEPCHSTTPPLPRRGSEMTETTSIAPTPTGLEQARLWVRRLGTLGPALGLILVYTLFAVIGPPSFSTVDTLVTIARQTSIVGTAALGMTVIIIAG